MAEIEIEKKFLLTDIQKQALLDGAVFNKEKKIADSYFDDENYSLTISDNWLRLRNGSFELKAPLASSTGQENTNRYREIIVESEIADELGFKLESSLADELEKRGITPFSICHTTRQSYEKEGFTIDIDSATYDNTDFVYDIAEIELIAENESQADATEARIIEFAVRHGLDIHGMILGKIGAHLQNENPKHYHALVDAGILK